MQIDLALLGARGKFCSTSDAGKSASDASIFCGGIGQAQLRSLGMAHRPKLDQKGKVVLVPNTKGVEL